MRTLKFVTILMAILIVGGTATLGVLIARRLGAAAPAHSRTELAQPPGTHITGIAGTPAGLAITLQGGGPDRVILLDPHTLAPTATLSLSH